MGYGRNSIPGDSAMKFSLKQDSGPSELCGSWRSDVAKYIIFLTDTWLGTDNSFKDDNALRLKEVQEQAIKQNIKVLVLGVGVDQERNTSIQLLNHNNSDAWYFWKWISENTTGTGDSSWDLTINADKMATALEESCKLPVFVDSLPDDTVSVTVTNPIE